MRKACLLFQALAAFGMAAAQHEPLPPAWRDSIDAHWARLDAEFADSLHSPLSPEDRAHFTHLEHFPPDPDLVVTASFKPIKNAKPFQMKTTTDRLPVYKPYGVLTFKLNGHRFKLTVFQNQELITRPGYANYLFLPFTDLTNGNETYGGGRYIDLSGPLDGRVVVDFNRAYNPYCAYAHRYSCPIVPSENFLPVAIKAGVLKFHD